MNKEHRRKERIFFFFFFLTQFLTAPLSLPFLSLPTLSVPLRHVTVTTKLAKFLVGDGGGGDFTVRSGALSAVAIWVLCGS